MRQEGWIAWHAGPSCRTDLRRSLSVALAASTIACNADVRTTS